MKLFILAVIALLVIVDNANAADDVIFAGDCSATENTCKAAEKTVCGETDKVCVCANSQIFDTECKACATDADCGTDGMCKDKTNCECKDGKALKADARKTDKGFACEAPSAKEKCGADADLEVKESKCACKTEGKTLTWDKATYAYKCEEAAGAAVPLVSLLALGVIAIAKYL